MGSIEPLPSTGISKVLGLCEILDDHGGKEDVYRLAQDLHMPFGELLLVIKGAEMLGLVTKVAAPTELAKAADALSEDLLSRSAASLQGIKEYLKFASRMDPGAATAYSSVLNAAVSSSQPRK